MRYVVGYTPRQRGRDAVSLAATLARAQSARLDVVVVLPTENATYDMYVPDRAYHSYLDEQGREWLEAGLAEVPGDVPATGRIQRAESITEGLIAAATDDEQGDEAALIVIGSSPRGLVGQFTIGSVAGALLHASPVPVALAPSGYDVQPAITRITCATGTRPGAEELLDVAARSAAGRGVPLRLVSLLALGTDEPSRHRARLDAAEQHAASLAGKARAVLSDRSPVSTVVGQGRTLEEAVRALDFEPGEIMLVGSSRLASPRRLFLGASAHKMLRALSIPMVVVPRDYPVPEGVPHE